MKTLKETMLNMLDNEPYNLNVKIEDDPFGKTKDKIRDVITSEFFKPFDEIVSPTYAKRILQLLWDYYYNKDSDNKPFDTQTSKELKKDIKTIQAFVNLMEKNCVYHNDDEQNYLNKQDDRFVFDYCKDLIVDLETKQFKKNITYRRTQLRVCKTDLKNFFYNLKKTYPQLRTQEDIKDFIDNTIK